MTSTIAAGCTDEEPLPFDDTCPHCQRSSDLGEVFADCWYWCKQCRKRVFTYVYEDDEIGGSHITLGDGETYPATPAPRLTGRAKTRALWRKRGRR